MNATTPITRESLRARYDAACEERDAIEARIAPLREELRKAADKAEEYRVAAMKVAAELDQARGGKKWFELKREIGWLAKALGGK